MKKMIVLIFILSMFVFLSSVGAVDRSPKNKDKDRKEKTSEIKEMTKEKAEKKSRSSALSGKTIRGSEGKYKAVADKPESGKKNSEPQKLRERYDYFTDTDNDGIDDRLQKKAKKDEKNKQIQIEKIPEIKEKRSTSKVAPQSPKQKSSKPEKTSKPETKETKKELKPKEIDRKRVPDGK